MKKFGIGKKLSLFSKKLDNKNVRYLLILLLVAYSAFLVPAYNETVAPLFDSWVIRILFVLVIIATIPKDIVLGVLLLLAFGVSMFVNYRGYSMRSMSDASAPGVQQLAGQIGQTADQLGQVVSVPVGKLIDTTGRVVGTTVGAAGEVVGAADRATGQVVSGVVRETGRVVGDIAGGLSMIGGGGNPQGFNIGYAQCVKGTGDGLCRGVGNVGMTTQGLGMPVGYPGNEVGAMV